MEFTVRSDSFKDGDYLAKDHILSAEYGFGCEGGNKSPHLAWSGAPTSTKSFAVTCFDPDAPTGSGFWHWLVVNVPPDVNELALDAGNPKVRKLPKEALQTRTDFGAPGYGGPCPPPGDHPYRYLFTVFAVGADSLPVTADTSAAIIGFQLNFNTLAKVAIVGLYKRRENDRVGRLRWRKNPAVEQLFGGGRRMKQVELYRHVRHAAQIEGLSKRAAARRFGIDVRTVSKMTERDAPKNHTRMDEAPKG
jgi:Raf kinase inhibitor-like YbhB/YbcL family protein